MTSCSICFLFVNNNNNSFTYYRWAALIGFNNDWLYLYLCSLTLRGLINIHSLIHSYCRHVCNVYTAGVRLNSCWMCHFTTDEWMTIQP